MTKWFWLSTFLIYTSLLFAQSPAYRILSIPVQKDNRSLIEPWAGGMNAPQFSSGDLDGDGIHDLFVFDRSGM